MAYQKSEKKAVEEPCVKFAKDLGIDVLKVNPLWYSGWDDRIFFIPGGVILLIEFKRPGGKVSKKQADRHKRLIDAGYDHHVIDNIEEGKALIGARLEAYRLHEESRQVGRGKSGVRAVPRPRIKEDEHHAQLVSRTPGKRSRS